MIRIRERRKEEKKQTEKPQPTIFLFLGLSNSMEKSSWVGCKLSVSLFLMDRPMSIASMHITHNVQTGWCIYIWYIILVVLYI